MKNGVVNREDIFTRIIFACVLLVVTWAPIPLGSNRPLAWFGMEVAVYMLLCAWGVVALWFGLDHGRWRRNFKIGTALLIWLGLIFLQTVSLPEHMIAKLNPFVHQQQQSLALVNIEGNSTLSIDVGRTMRELLKYGAYVSLFLVVLGTVTNKFRLLVLVACLVLIGVGEAVFGLYANATGFVVFPDLGGDTTLREGTFVNRNHYANYLTMILCIACGLLMWVIDSQERGARANVLRYNDSGLALTATLVGVVLILLAAILTSESRSPLVFLGIAFVVTLLVTRRFKGKGSAEIIVAPIVLVGAAVVAVVIGFDDSVYRLLDRDLLGGERMTQNHLGLEMLQDVWLTGVGAGNYEWTFQMFRDDGLRFATYDHAHNDYLESCLEQGVPTALVLATSVGLMLREMYRGYRSRRNPLIRGVIFGCVLSMVYMLIHSLVEFNFRIPANAMLFFVIGAMGIAACEVDKRTARRTKADQSRGYEI